MSLNYTNQYIQSILSYIDYITFDGTDGKEILLNKNYTNLTDKTSFLNRAKEYIDNPITYAEMESSLEFFTSHFKIINQETADNSNGFTGTTYQLISPIEGSTYNVGEIFVSYTGTEAESGDYFTDLKLTFSDSITFTRSSQEPLALDYLKRTLNNSNGNVVNISGHSLGGYLAARSYYYLTTEEIKKIGEVTTFNGAGFSVLDGGLDPVKRALYEEKINNIFSYRGLNVTTSNIGEIDISNALKGSWTLISTFQHLGPRIGVFTENPGGWKGNHSMSMLVNTMGFYSILSKIITDVFYVEDDNGVEYLGDDAVVYWVNKLLSGSFYDTIDFGQAYNTLASKIMEMFNIPENESSKAGYPSAQFLSLFDYFTENNNLKIKIFENVHSESPVITNFDNNSNRAYMYALLNDLPFTVIVPESYNTGIYQKTNQDGFQYTSNIKYNVEYYSEDYISLRSIYNKLYTKILSDKLSSSLTYNFTDATIVIDGFDKFAFIDEINVSGSPNNYNVIYVNTTKDEYIPDNVPLIYFKADTGRYLDVKLGNAIIYDTPGNDSIRIYSDNNIINSTYGTDIIEIVSGTVGNVIMLKDLIATDKEQSLIVRNNSQLEHSLTISADNVNMGDLIGRISDNKDFTLDFGNKVIILSGNTDLNVGGSQHSSADINALLKNFPELYSVAAGHNFVFNEKFIDDYIKITAKNFSGQLGYENTQTVSSEHAAYVIDKLTQYSQDMNDSSSLFIQEEKNKLNNKVTSISSSLNVNGLQEDILNMVIPLIKNKVEAQSVAFILQNKLDDFKYLDLSHQVNMATEDGMANNRADNIYGKKETKNYIAHYTSEGDKYWVWDGKYYYNRAIDGVQVSAFYDSVERGEVMNYYVENIVLKSSSTFSSNVLSGSNGSDLLIGEHVYGQTNDFGVAGGKTVTEANTVQNGNDILIGKVASAYSGNNFIYGSEGAYGGSGNDLIIGGGTIMANQNYKNDTESTNNENEIIILSLSDVYSSNGKNNIIDLGEAGSNIFGTRNDTFIGGSGHSTFIGGYNAYFALRYGDISFGLDGENFLETFRMKFNILDDFYNLHKVNQSLGKNIILAGSGGVSASLGYGDYIENMKGGGGQIIGLGGNDIFIKDHTGIISGGSSNINITGNNNTVYFGVKDQYSLSNANNNILYSRGYRDNINLGNDYYQITGIDNTLLLGKSSYNIKLDGESTQVKFKENNNNNNIVINESKTTSIDVGFQNILTIESQNEISLRYGNLTELLINTRSPLSLNSIISDRIVLQNYNGMNNSDIFALYSVTVDNLTASSGIITGSVTDVSTASFEGTLGGFSLNGSALGANVELKGFIEGVNTLFNNVKSFNFQQTIRTYEQAIIEIKDSNIDNYTSSGSTRFSGQNTNIDSLTVSGLKNSISVDGSVNSAILSSTSELFFNAKSIKSLQASSNGVVVKGNNVLGAISVGMGIYGNSLMVDNASFIEVSNSGYGSMFLSVTNSDVVNIISGYYNGAVFTSVNTVNINLDNVNPLSSFNGDNIHLTSTKPLSIRYSNNKYYLNNVSFTFIPDSVTVSGRQYNSEQLAVLFEVLKKSNLVQATALIDSTGIGYDSIGDTNNQGVHVDSGIYIGTDSDDIVYATDNKAYRIKAGKGDDYIDFGTKPRDSYTHIIEYNRGDGLDTINSNSENIEIRLGNIASNELSFKMIDDVVTNNKVLKVFLGTEQIFTINGFLISNIIFKASDKNILKADIISLTSTIYGTDNGEVIEGLTTDTYIVAGKGNDTINFIGNNKNVLYYSRGDGVDIVNSVSNFEIRFSADILKSSVRYSKVSENVYDIYLDAIKILTLTNTNQSKFIFSNGDVVDGYYINSYLSEQLGGKPFYENGIYTGSDLPDYYDLSEGGEYHLKGNKGNDTFNFGGNNEHSILDYTEGDGVDTLEGYSKNVDINLINMSSEFLTSIYENGYLHLYYKGVKIMRIDDVDKSNINIHMSDKSFTQTEIFIWAYGESETTPTDPANTDGDDIITNDPTIDNNIYAGKGNDIINLTSNPAYPNVVNNIYYFDGDGHETINNDSNSKYKILLANTIAEEDVSYNTGFVNGSVMLYISYKNDVIFTIPSFNFNDFTIDYLSSGNSIDMDSLSENLMMNYGTDGDDILTSNQGVAVFFADDGNDIINVSSNIMAADIYAGGGDDTININNYGFNNINYNDGDGYDTIILNNHDNTMILNLYDYDEASIRFEYDLTNPNNLNIYSDETKIITIENYVIDDVSFESISIELNDNTLEGADINAKAVSGSESSKLLADSNINGLISFMASTPDDSDTATSDTQSASSYIKKNE